MHGCEVWHVVKDAREDEIIDQGVNGWSRHYKYYRCNQNPEIRGVIGAKKACREAAYHEKGSPWKEECCTPRFMFASMISWVLTRGDVWMYIVW